MINSENKIYLAPFQGVTTYTYRTVYGKYFKGIDKLFTAFFTSVHKTKTLERRGADLNNTHQYGVEVVPQILSKDAEEIIRFANYCEEKGFKEINWNLGCPYPRVANKKRGSGMLPYPDELDKILTEALAEINIGLSIKCRLGYFSDEEIFPVLDVVNSHNITELIVHARIGKQLYSGGVRPDVFEKVIKKCNKPLAYNGDIFKPEDYINFSSRFSGVNNWMLGRGMLRNPFLPEIIKGYSMPPLKEQSEIIYKFVTDLYLAYRKHMNDRPQAVSVMKEYWSFLAYSFDNRQKVFNRIKKTNSFDDYEDAVGFVMKNHEWLGVESTNKQDEF